MAYQIIMFHGSKAQNNPYPVYAILANNRPFYLILGPFLSFQNFYYLGLPHKKTRQWTICLQCKRPGLDLGQEDPLEKGKDTHSGILAGRVPWTEEPGGLQSIASQRVRHNWVTNTFTSHKKITQKEKIQKLHIRNVCKNKKAYLSETFMAAAFKKRTYILLALYKK